MMSQEQNDLITRTGASEPCGKLMRMYWQPAALLDELEGPRPVRPVKLLGESLVLFRDEQGRYGLIERHCAHRGADLPLAGWNQAACAAPSMAGCSTPRADAWRRRLSQEIQNSAKASSSAPIR